MIGSPGPEVLAGTRLRDVDEAGNFVQRPSVETSISASTPSGRVVIDSVPRIPDNQGIVMGRGVAKWIDASGREVYGLGPVVMVGGERHMPTVERQIHLHQIGRVLRGAS